MKVSVDQPSESLPPAAPSPRNPPAERRPPPLAESPGLVPANVHIRPAGFCDAKYLFLSIAKGSNCLLKYPVDSLHV